MRITIDPGLDKVEEAMNVAFKEPVNKILDLEMINWHKKKKILRDKFNLGEKVFEQI
jgi:hypothetical protein